MKKICRKLRINFLRMKKRERLFSDEYFDIGENFLSWFVVFCAAGLVIGFVYIMISICNHK
mgnify:CR=1 FL=1